MIQRASLAVLFFLLLASRAVPQNVTLRSISPQTRIVSNFTPGTTMTKAVGETMVERDSWMTYPGFKATEGFTPPDIDGEKKFLPIKKEARWICMESISADEYGCMRNPFGADGVKVTAQEFAIMASYDTVINKSGDIVGVVKKISGGGFMKYDNVIAGKLIPVEVPFKSLYRQELIYNGKSKDTINLSYREYKGGLARVAFYQELTYDLLESREIAFRDLRIEIMEATNSTIKFIVKK